MPNHSRVLFGWAVIVFFALQTGVDLAHSVTAFPFVHYGMFSESFAQPDSLAVYTVTVDGKALLAKDFRVYRWDMIQTPLAGFEKQQVTRDFSFDKEMMRIGFSRVGCSAVFRQFSPQLDNEPSANADFSRWYKQYLSGLLGYPIHTLRVDKVWYRYADGQLQSYRKETRINS